MSEAHAIIRARERWGLELSENDLRRMVRKIERGDATFVRNGELGVKIFSVPWGDLRLPVVFAPIVRAIFTVLPAQEATGPSKDRDDGGADAAG